ncbi:hypothetical protein LP52_08700 [Streptomonospora alba]|uniref:DUF418 domain-containing protein n=1 Tax=Streptomonospora alba TaxID=183763 RepID=A0A0C2JR24_9ACTN|nr:hypothetical protein LP52_08700 [Streptomonospora alba]
MTALDALRGFALCGIVFINIPQTMEMYAHAGQMPFELRFFVFGRFYPIFYLLFGLGFGIFLRSAERRWDKPRLLLVRRFTALAVLGGLLHLIQPGEVLLPFAVAGFLVLLPVSYLPRRGVVAAGLVLTTVGVLAGVGGFGLLPGLFALGFALAELRVAQTLHRRAAQSAVLAAAAAAAAAASVGLVALELPAPAQPRIGLLLSVSMAACYVGLFLLLMRTPAARPLDAVLGPMGRMALTNYVTAALLFVPIGLAMGLHGSSLWAQAAALGAGILLLQAVWSALWLRAFAYGPLEWLWRCVTYGKLLPIKERA